MHRETATFTFRDAIPLAEIESTLLLALMGAESLHGSAGVRLQTGHYLDSATRRCIIDTSDMVGRDLARLFIGFLTREFGAAGFSVSRSGGQSPPSASDAFKRN